MKTIQYGNETWILHSENGRIERHGTVNPSNNWRVTGAVRMNNFGAIVERFSLAQIMNTAIQWKYKNGGQRVHITDFDHGTHRTWMSPLHFIR